MPEEKELTLEEGLAQLDAITKKMEDPSISLEERFELYKQGVELVKTCSAKIDMVEKSLKKVNDDGMVSELF